MVNTSAPQINTIRIVDESRKKGSEKSLMRTDRPYLMVVKLQEDCLYHDETRAAYIESVMRVQLLWNIGETWWAELDFKVFHHPSPWLVFLGGGDAVEAFDVQCNRAVQAW